MILKIGNAICFRLPPLRPGSGLAEILEPSMQRAFMHSKFSREFTEIGFVRLEPPFANRTLVGSNPISIGIQHGL